MNRRNNDEASTVVELGEADLALVQGGTAILPWLPPVFPIRNPVAPLPGPNPVLARPDAGPRPNPFVSVQDLSVVSIDAAVFGL